MDIFEQLRRDEGWRSHPYQDSRGILTIGYGTNLAAGITQAEGELLLESRANASKAELLKALPWASSLSDARFGALWNMAYNLGVPGLLTFHQFLGLMQQGKFSEAAEDLIHTAWYTQVGSRAHRLKIQIETDTWQ